MFFLSRYLSFPAFFHLKLLPPSISLFRLSKFLSFLFLSIYHITLSISSYDNLHLFILLYLSLLLNLHYTTSMLYLFTLYLLITLSLFVSFLFMHFSLTSPTIYLSVFPPSCLFSSPSSFHFDVPFRAPFGTTSIVVPPLLISLRNSFCHPYLCDTLVVELQIFPQNCNFFP